MDGRVIWHLWRATVICHTLWDMLRILNSYLSCLVSNVETGKAKYFLSQHFWLRVPLIHSLCPFYFVGNFQKAFFCLPDKRDKCYGVSLFLAFSFLEFGCDVRNCDISMCSWSKAKIISESLALMLLNCWTNTISCLCLVLLYEPC